MAGIQIEERHRDYLADLVEHASLGHPLLGQLPGPTGKLIPFGPSHLLLYALFDDYAQSAWTYWGWHSEDETAPWRAGVITKSALYCQRLVQERHCDDEWALRIHMRHSNLRQELQGWYKRIDYMPEQSKYEVGASGEEFPAPPDLLYLIWVVLEAADKWASDKRMVFYIDTEGEDYTNAVRWQETFQMMRNNLLPQMRRAQTGSPPPPKQKRWWQR